jgi:hypothetical protein
MGECVRPCFSQPRRCHGAGAAHAQVDLAGSGSHSRAEQVTRPVSRGCQGIRGARPEASQAAGGGHLDAGSPSPAAIAGAQRGPPRAAHLDPSGVEAARPGQHVAAAVAAVGDGKEHEPRLGQHRCHARADGVASLGCAERALERVGRDDDDHGPRACSSATRSLSRRWPPPPRCSHHAPRTPGRRCRARGTPPEPRRRAGWPRGEHRTGRPVPPGAPRCRSWCPRRTAPARTGRRSSRGYGRAWGCSAPLERVAPPGCPS